MTLFPWHQTQPFFQRISIHLPAKERLLNLALAFAPPKVPVPFLARPRVPVLFPIHHSASTKSLHAPHSAYLGTPNVPVPFRFFEVKGACPFCFLTKVPVPFVLR